MNELTTASSLKIQLPKRAAKTLQEYLLSRLALPISALILA